MKVHLRGITEDDLEMLREHRNRPDTRVWLGHSKEISSGEQQVWWSRAKESKSAVFQIASDKKTGLDVGLVRVSDVSFGDACVGADVFAAHRGNGYGHAVFSAACDLAAYLGASRLWLKVFTENEPAVRVYKRAGFAFDPDSPVELYYRPSLRTAMRYPTAGDFLHYATMRRYP